MQETIERVTDWTALQRALVMSKNGPAPAAGRRAGATAESDAAYAGVESMAGLLGLEFPPLPDLLDTPADDEIDAAACGLDDVDERLLPWSEFFDRADDDWAVTMRQSTKSSEPAAPTDQRVAKGTKTTKLAKKSRTK